MKNKKINVELDLEDLLGLKEPSKDSLEYDILFVMENGIDEYVKLRENERNKDREFVELFKRNYDEIVKFISLDPKRRIAVDCFTCLKGVDLTKQYGKPEKKGISCRLFLLFFYLLINSLYNLICSMLFL